MSCGTGGPEMPAAAAGGSIREPQKALADTTALEDMLLECAGGACLKAHRSILSVHSPVLRDVIDATLTDGSMNVLPVGARCLLCVYARVRGSNLKLATGARARTVWMLGLQ